MSSNGHGPLDPRMAHGPWASHQNLLSRGSQEWSYSRGKMISLLFLENTDFGRKTWGEILRKLPGTHFSDSSTGLSQHPWLLHMRMWADSKMFPSFSRLPMSVSPLSVILMCGLLKGSKGIVSASWISPEKKLTDLCWNFSSILSPKFSIFELLYKTFFCRFEF